MTAPRVQLDHITKRFPGVVALDDISLRVMPGEVHAICGENGAGKSTLMNILTGNLLPDSGTVAINGAAVHLESPGDAFNAGIAIVHQHLSLAENLNVAENIYANRAPLTPWGLIRYDALYRQTEGLLAALRTPLPPRAPVHRLSPAQKQMVEIAKALSHEPQLLILDEPTASLTDTETQTLFNIIAQLKAKGVSIIYISHRLSEVFAVADTVSVLKDGRYQGTFPKATLDQQKLIRLMVGRDLREMEKPVPPSGEVLLELTDLCNKKLQHISFQLHRGEILGLAGLIGAGRTEVARAIFGADPISAGHVFVRGKQATIQHPADAMKLGIAYVPEERKALGLFPHMSVEMNIASAMMSASGRQVMFDAVTARRQAETSRQELRVATPSIDKKVGELSGGNQQKVILARWLTTKPDILIVDEPTHGIDVGAKYEIYELLRTLAAAGKGILVISSEMPELLGLSDRILVMRAGKITGALRRGEATEEKIMALATLEQ